MVFKKPYALLIKHFKLIHIIITLFMAFLIYKMTGIISFFNEYVSSGWKSITESEVTSYISGFMYISLIIIVILSIVIYLLMRFKKKPRLYYLLTPLLYIILFVALLVTSSTLKGAVVDVISPIKVRAIRDVLLIIVILQFVVIIFSLLRAIGFDVKKFNFRQDIADLEITELDNEEVEVDFEVKKYKISRNFKRWYRNFGYIFSEHKFIWTFTLIVFMLIVVVIILYNIFVINKSYNQNKIVTLDNYSISVTDSTIVTSDYKNNEISDKYKYLIVNVNIINHIKDNIFNLENLSLESNGKIYNTINSGYSKFSDFGYGYTEGLTLSTEKNNKYIFAFKIPKENKIGKSYLKYLYKIEYKKGSAIPKYKRIKLNFKNYENNNNVIENKLNDNVTFNNNSIKIKTIEFNDQYTYKYNFCTSKNDCNESIGYITPSSSNNAKILKLDAETTFDSDNPITKFNNPGEFFESYASIKYTKNNKTYLQRNVTNLTPNNINNNEIYLNVSKEIESAEKISIEFKNMGVRYSYVIK